MAETRRQYETVIAIAGKVLGSFKGAMATVNASMRALQARMKQMNAAMIAGANSIIGSFKKIGAAFTVLGGIFAAFLAANVFKKIFGGAADEALKAEQRVRALSYALLANDKMRAKGESFALRQIDLFKKQAVELEKQGVLSRAIFENFAVGLANIGFSPRRILDSTKAMGDLLVKARGVRATEEDSLELNSAMGKAIKQGRLMGMRQFLPMLDTGKEAMKAFKEKTYEERLAFLLNEARKFAGANEKALTDPGGRYQHFQNQLRAFGEDIGNKILPAQDKMAAAWERILPLIQPIIESMTEGFLGALESLATFTETTLIPKFKEFLEWMRGPFSEHFSKMWPKFQEMLGKIGEAFMNMLGKLTGEKKFSFGNFLLKTLDALGKAFTWIGKNAKWLVPTILGLVAAFLVLDAALTAAGAIMAIFAAPMTLVVAGVIILIGALTAAVVLMITNWEQAKKNFATGWAWAEKIPIIGNLFKFWHWIFDQILNVWNKLVEAWKWVQDNGASLFKGIGKAIEDWILTPIGKIYSKWKEFMNYLKTGISSTPASELMMQPPAGWQGGGGGGVNATSAAMTATGVGASGIPLATAGMAGLGPAGAAGAGIPVTVASYGGPTEPGQVMGSYDNVLGLGDVAISPNLIPLLGAPSPSNYVSLDGQRYHVADTSWYTPGHPTSNMVEIWGYGNQIKRAGMVAKAMARGGIVHGSTFARLGESGSEAVIPLSGGRRSAGLLNYAANALGGFGRAPAGDTHVSFAPNITINGNATEAEQRAMDSRLRDLTRDFITQFKRAQAQERRLSYESGYSG